MKTDPGADASIGEIGGLSGGLSERKPGLPALTACGPRQPLAAFTASSRPQIWPQVAT